MKCWADACNRMVRCEPQNKRWELQPLRSKRIGLNTRKGRTKKTKGTNQTNHKAGKIKATRQTHTRIIGIGSTQTDRFNSANQSQGTRKMKEMRWDETRGEENKTHQLLIVVWHLLCIVVLHRTWTDNKLIDGLDENGSIQNDKDEIPNESNPSLWMELKERKGKGWKSSSRGLVVSCSPVRSFTFVSVTNFA